MRVALVACSARKLDRRAPAADLYSPSTLFRFATAWAARHADVAYVLSARHGLVPMDRQLDPYDQTLVGASRHERQQWAAQVAVQIVGAVPPGATLVFLAGQHYRRDLVPLLDQWKVEIPLRGLGIGRQLAFLRRDQK